METLTQEKESKVREYDYEQLLQKMFSALVIHQQYDSFRKLVTELERGNLEQEIFEWFFDFEIFDEENPAEMEEADWLATKIANDILDRVEDGRLNIKGAQAEFDI